MPVRRRAAGRKEQKTEGSESTVRGPTATGVNCRVTFQRRKRSQMRFPFSAKGELAETLEESGGLGRRTRRTSLSQGESQNPRAHGPAPKQAH